MDNKSGLENKSGIRQTNKSIMSKYNPDEEKKYK